MPFYLRTGKRLPRRVTEVALNLRKAPHLPFNGTDVRALGSNAVVLRIQPDEGITLRFGAKVPATPMELRDVNMDFGYDSSFAESSPEAYERLLLDVLLGSEPLFPQPEEVELSWELLDPVLERWANRDSSPRPLRLRHLGSTVRRRHAGQGWLQLATAVGGATMIINLTDTGTAAVQQAMSKARRNVGGASGLVFTLVVVDGTQRVRPGARGLPRGRHASTRPASCW